MTIYLRMKRGEDIQIVDPRTAASMHEYRCIGVEPGTAHIPQPIIAAEIEHYMSRAYVAETERNAMQPVVEAATEYFLCPQDHRNAERFRQAVAAYLGEAS